MFISEVGGCGCVALLCESDPSSRTVLDPGNGSGQECGSFLLGQVFVYGLF